MGWPKTKNAITTKLKPWPKAAAGERANPGKEKSDGWGKARTWNEQSDYPEHWEPDGYVHRERNYLYYALE